MGNANHAIYTVRCVVHVHLNATVKCAIYIPVQHPAAEMSSLAQLDDMIVPDALFDHMMISQLV